MGLGALGQWAVGSEGVCLCLSLQGQATKTKPPSGLPVRLFASLFRSSLGAFLLVCSATCSPRPMGRR